MRRRAFRVFPLVVAVCAVGGLVLSCVPWGLRRAYADCARNRTSACLADLGFAEADRAWHLPAYLIEIDQLAQIGHIDAAYALEKRIQAAAGLTAAAAKDAADKRVASQRITAAIRTGASPRAAFEATPQADAGSLWISALDLLGRQPYTAAAMQDASGDAMTRVTVSGMAALIVSLAGAERPPAARSHLAYAAALQVMIGDRDAVLRTLALRPSGDRPETGFDADLVQLIGLEPALRFCQGAEGCESATRIRLAVAAGDAARVRTDLKQVFALAANAAPWPDLDQMEKVVALAVTGGDRVQALALARSLAATAETRPALFPVFPHIQAARALATAGADPAEIRQSLDRAEAAFPDNPGAIVGIGVNAGPIQGRGFGLEAQARREIAGLRARLGDTDKAIALMDGRTDPDFAWGDMLTRAIPLADLHRLLQAAGAALSADDLAHVRACHAQTLAQDIDGSAPDAAQAAWARATAQDLLAARPLRGPRAGLTYACLARLGESLGDGDIQRRAVQRMAEDALGSGDYLALFRASIAAHGLEAAPPGG